jgi:hypothetical protein
MDCTNIRSELTLYADGLLGEADSARVSQHLVECPLCRDENAGLRELRIAMRRMKRPEVPVPLQLQLRRAIANEINVQKTTWLPISAVDRAWLRLTVMPYAVGTVASIVIGFTVLTMMFSGIRDRTTIAGTQGGMDTVMLASNRNPFSNAGDVVSPIDFAKTRLDVSQESPSVNPQGALVALTKSFIRGGMHDDEVVVVADVFGNGLAQVAEVVEPSRDSRAVANLEKALASNDPQYRAFLAADMDNRADSVRVVLKFQSVDVPTHRRSHHP